MGESIEQIWTRGMGHNTIKLYLYGVKSLFIQICIQNITSKLNLYRKNALISAVIRCKKCQG